MSIELRTEMYGEKNYHGHPNYVLIWIGLLVLFGLSMLAAYLEHRVLAIGAIFFLAVIKALLVAGNYMHLRYEPKLIWCAMIFALLCLVFLFFGLWPDVVLAVKGAEP